MALSDVIAFFAILFFLQPTTTSSDFLTPLVSPIFDDMCKAVECGKGTCKYSPDSTFLFVCECDPGWKQTRSEHDDHLKFLPCIIPNCTLNYSCTEAPSPAPRKEGRANESIFEPCHWTHCGGGKCNKTSTFSYSCKCAAGYYNLLNVTAFPCFRECAIGMDCSNLGISMSNKSTTPTSIVADNGGNKARSVLQENHHWLSILMMFLAILKWK